MKKKIYLLTGFLGSGKTTFLQNLLAQALPLHKIGVIINEFGRAGIDGSLIARNGLVMRELSGGSIFCACLKSNFIAALDTFLDLPIEYLFIESSGLADPAGFHRISSFINRPACIASVSALCIVDGKYFLDYLDMFTAVETQIRTADLILINKIDLITADGLSIIESTISSMNPVARILRTSFGVFDIKKLPELTSKHAYVTADEHPDIRPFTHILMADNIISKEQLLNFIQAVLLFSLRVKGFIITTDGLTKVDAVGSTTTIIRSDDAMTPELIIIAKQALPINREIVSAWNTHCTGSIKLT